MSRMVQRALAVILATALLLASVGGAAARERHFPETGQTVRDVFLEFFEANGGIDIFGYPRTGEFNQEGRWVQYFQRARFEWWPENPPGYQVQLGLLASELGRGRPASVQSSDPTRRYFPETQHSIGGAFRDFWERRGGLALFGYPIGEEIVENGLTVQYFQRARFEWHGENPPSHRVQLGLLGDEMIALGRVSVPAEAAPQAGTQGPASLVAAAPGRLVVSTGVGGDFYLMNPNGSDVVKLGQGVDPAISPDGTKVAYARWEFPNPGLYVMGVEGGSPTLVYPGEGIRGPLFSPDTSMIAFYQHNRCIRVIRPWPIQDDCFQIKVIPSGGGQDWLPPGQSAYAKSPTWSPDGTKIVFKDEKWLAVVSAVDREKASARPLSQFEPRYYTPAWSPLGGQIAVALDRNRSGYEIGLIPDDGRVSFVQLTRSPAFGDPTATNVSPAWSPDGSRIAFASNRDGALKIWVMGADGSNPVKVSDIPLRSENALERFVSWGGR